MVDGTWVDYDNKTSEHIIILPGGGPAIKARTVKPKPSSSRWCAKAIKEIQATVKIPNPIDKDQREPRVERDTRGTGHERQGGG